MKVYLVEVAVLLAVTSFYLLLQKTQIRRQRPESQKVRSQSNQYFVSASLDDQKKIFKCTQDNINAQEALKNYTFIPCAVFRNVLYQHLQ
uniref:Putative salivary secreted peptide n=1 Tax=Ixodes ricinus TaxID=34613 RepID=V5HF56_IXORI